MIKRLVVLALMSIAWIVTVPAVTFHDLDTTRPLRCIFSLKHHNRIMVDNGRVRKIIFPEENLSIRLEEHSGQAFIYTIGQLIKPVTLAVITESGLVQDIEIEFADKATEVVILKEPIIESESGELNEKECNNDSLKEYDAPQSLVDTIFLGRIPEGYASCSLCRTFWQIKSGIQATPIVKLEGKKDCIYIYEISNTAKRRLNISEEDLEIEGCQWICLETNQIRPKEKILGIVCVGLP
ncbi:TraK domain-containing protein [Candidatus Protochlamydia phocaeensis]|uniref:TraK domain-containing protein n=1 Tax=Candidatus Protochlamydia phocaeensis TaxID=1414722 RepID=UPI000838857A|nr:type-F conjugative transfer system secretin TraK [Candidatus Protochlamydia phocaeensis]